MFVDVQTHLTFVTRERVNELVEALNIGGWPGLVLDLELAQCLAAIQDFGLWEDYMEEGGMKNPPVCSSLSQR